MNYSHDPIFICGEGRSGTKLLRDILGKHPSIYVFRCESSIFVSSIFHKIKIPSGLPKEILLKSIMATMLSKNRIQAQKAINSKIFTEELESIYQDLLKQKLLDSCPVEYLLAFDFLANFIATNIMKKSRWLEKTPYHINYLDQILAFYPDAKIIVIYRDPRAVVSSWLKKDKDKTLLGVVLNWINVSKRVAALSLQPALRRQIHFLSYEDLISNPETQVKRICDFLSEQFEASLLDVTVVNSLFVEKGQPGFNQEAISRWKTQLSPSQKNLIDLLTFKYRKILRYEDSSRARSMDYLIVFLFALPKELLVFCIKKFIKLLKWV